MGPKVNAKAAAAKDKKAANQAVKDAEAGRKAAEVEAAEWSKGSNARASSRAADAGKIYILPMFDCRT